MHSKDKVDPALKKDVVYQWHCPKPNCNSSYIGEMSRSLSECIKEHGKQGNSAIFTIVQTKATHYLN